jgi:hypothetical protein
MIMNDQELAVTRQRIQQFQDLLNRTTRHWYTWLDHGLLSC